MSLVISILKILTANVLFYYFILKSYLLSPFREILMEFINGPVSELSTNDFLTYWIQSKFLSFFPLTSDCSVAPFPPILCSLCTLHILLGELFCSSWWVGVSIQSCLALRDFMDCSPPGSSGPGIFQARILEWVAIRLLEDVHDPEIKPASAVSHALEGGFFTTVLSGKPQ